VIDFAIIAHLKSGKLQTKAFQLNDHERLKQYLEKTHEL